MTTLPPRNVLITGSAKRIGRSIALNLASEGWNIAVHYRGSAEDATNTVQEIIKAGGHAVALQADLSDINSLSPLVTSANNELGPLTALVNNASLFANDDLATLTPETWAAHMDTNLRAPLFLAQAFAKQLPADTQGNIINMIDQRVWRLTPRFLSYTSSKAGLWTLTQTLAQTLAPKVRVNGIGPGPTLSNDRQSDADFQAQTDATLLQRQITPEEICAAIRFILAAPALTGQMIALDSGQHLAWETPDASGPE
jgi:NAD(P)-dependent dehydrogenase (short-subunit alcohol dehydrogenase family)